MHEECFPFLKPASQRSTTLHMELLFKACIFVLHKSGPGSGGVRHEGSSYQVGEMKTNKVRLH